MNNNFLNIHFVFYIDEVIKYYNYFVGKIDYYNYFTNKLKYYKYSE